MHHVPERPDIELVVAVRPALAPRKVEGDFERAMPRLRSAMPDPRQRAEYGEIAIPRVAGLRVQKDRRVTEAVAKVQGIAPQARAVGGAQATSLARLSP